MPFDVAAIVGSEIIKFAVKKGTEVLTKKSDKNKGKITKELEAGLTTQVKRGYTFSENITLFKLPDSRKILESSIHLKIKNQDRRFMSLGSKKTISEAAIINNYKNYLILGDVGAGKTTTIKRLIKKTFDLLFSEKVDDFIFSYPIVIKLGEIKKSETLLTHICGQIGIQYDKIPHVEEFVETKFKKSEILNPESGEYETIEEEYEITKTRTSYEYKIGNYSIESAIGELINDLKCIVFLDGLDEVHYGIREVVFNEIKQISQILSNSKLVITSRYISEAGSFKQFDVNEICALTNDQKREIATLWVDNPDDFLRTLNSLPYADLTDRPLFLNYLLLLFISNDDKLPAQAIDVYRQIILLVIRDWDYDKEVTISRHSKYKSFDTYRKEDFLSELAFDLTYTQNVQKSFSHRQLKKAYLNIYRRYPGLRQNDGNVVIEDIESHTGLIFEVFNDNFEFCHLSLQEFLAAKYLVSIPFTRTHYDLLRKYPNPLAIANVLSPRPSHWFAKLFLENIDEKNINHQLDGDKVYEYIDRLMVEKIIFPQPSIEVGTALIYLIDKFDGHRLGSKIKEFYKIKYVVESLELTSTVYNFKKKGNKVHFEIKSGSHKNELMLKFIQRGQFNQRMYWIT